MRKLKVFKRRQLTVSPNAADKMMSCYQELQVLDTTVKMAPQEIEIKSMFEIGTSKKLAYLRWDLDPEFIFRIVTRLDLTKSATLLNR